MGSLNNSSKSMTSCGRVGLSLTGHSYLAPYCDLVHVRPCRRQLGAATDLRCERQLESAISRTGAAIATPSAVSTNSSMLDSARIVTSVAQLAIPEIPTCARRRPINQPSPIKVKDTSVTLISALPLETDKALCGLFVGNVVTFRKLLIVIESASIIQHI